MIVLKWIKQHLIISIFISIGFGVLIGSQFDVSWMKSLIMPLTFMMVYPMMVTIKLDKLIGKSNIRLLVVTQLINFIVYPAIAYGIGQLFFADEPYFQLGLLLIALLPTSGMTISWTVMAKGNVSEAIRMVVIGLTIGALLAPVYITVLIGEAIDVPFWTIARQISLVVFVPLLAAYLTQRILIGRYSNERFQTSIKPIFPLFSTLGVVFIIFVAIALRAQVLVNNPSMILDILIPLLILYILFTIVSYGISKLFKREDGIALMNGTLIRSLSIALAITLSVFEGAGITALLIALAYVIQVQFAAWNVKLTPILFPKNNPE